MTQHTPGPWVFNGYSMAQKGTGKPIITLPEKYGGGEYYANARLIAAAPELLEALEACLARLQIVDAEAIKNSYHLPVIKAAAAINKAKGA